jgi:hypothetical protein
MFSLADGDKAWELSLSTPGTSNCVHVTDFTADLTASMCSVFIVTVRLHVNIIFGFRFV